MALEKSKLIVSIEVQGGDAEKALKKVGKEIDGLGKQAKKSGKDVTSFKDALDDVAKETVVLNQALELANKAISALGLTYQKTAGLFGEFETAMNKVRKTANFTAAETDKFGRKMQDLASQIPVAANELGVFASLGAQLGVRGSSDLNKFAETIARVTVTTDLMGEHASLAFARILNVTGEGIDSVDRFASTVVALGNKYATGEAAIVAMSNEVARSTKLFKLSSAEIAGIATALKELGNRAEIGGTAVGNVFLAIEKLIGDGGDKLERFAASVGMTGAAFKEQFAKNSAEGFVTFLRGMDQMIKASSSSEKALEELGLAGQGINKVIVPLTQDVARLEEILGDARQAFEENKALAAESAVVFGSLESETLKMENAFTRLGVNLGAILSPALKSIFQTITGAINSVGQFVASLSRIDFAGIASEASAAVMVIGGLAAIIKQAEIATIATNIAWGVWNGQITATIAQLPIVGGLLSMIIAKMGALVIAGAKLAIITAGITAIIVTVDFLIKNFKQLGNLAGIIGNALKREFTRFSIAVTEGYLWVEKLLSKLSGGGETKAIKAATKSIKEMKKELVELDKQQLKNLQSLKLNMGLAGKLAEAYRAIFGEGAKDIEDTKNKTKDLNKETDDLAKNAKKYVFVLRDMDTLVSDLAAQKIDPFGKIRVGVIGDVVDNAIYKMETLQKKAKDLAISANKNQTDFVKAEEANVRAMESRFSLEKLSIEANQKLKVELSKIEMGLMKEGQRLVAKQEITSAKMVKNAQDELVKRLKIVEALKLTGVEQELLTGKYIEQVMQADKLSKKLLEIAKIQGKIAEQKEIIDGSKDLLDLASQERAVLEDRESILKNEISVIERTAKIRGAELEVLRQQLRLRGILSDADDKRITDLQKILNLKMQEAREARILSEPVDAGLLASRAAPAVQQVKSNLPAAIEKANSMMLETTKKSAAIWEFSMTKAGAIFNAVPAKVAASAEQAKTAFADFELAPSFATGLEAASKALQVVGTGVSEGFAGAWMALRGAGLTVANQIAGTFKAVGKGLEPFTTGAAKRFASTIAEGFSQAASGFMSSFPKAAEKFQQAFDKVREIGSVIAGVAQLDFASIGKAGGMMADTFLGMMTGFFSGEFPKMLLNGLQAIRELPAKLLEVFSQLDTVVEGLISEFPAMVDRLLSLLPAIVQKLADAAPKLVSVLLDAIDKLIEAAPNLFARIIRKIPELVSMILERLPSIIQSLWEAIPLVITDIIRQIPSVLVSILDNLPDMIEQFISGLIGAIVEVAVAFVDTIIVNLPSIITAIIKAIPRIVVALVRGIINGLARAVRALFGGIKIPAPDIVDTKGISDKIKKEMGKISKAAKQANEEIFAVIDLDKVTGKKGPAAGMGTDVTASIDSGIQQLESVFSKIFKELKKAWLWVYNKVLKPFVEGVEKVFQWIWDKVLSPFLEFTKEVFMGLYENIFKPFMEGLSAVFGSLMEAVFMPIIRAFSIVFDGFSESVKIAFEGAGNILRSVVETIKNVFLSLRDVGMAIGGFISEAFKAPVRFFQELMKGNVEEAFKVVTDLFGTLKDTVIVALKPFEVLVTGLKNTFEEAISPLKKIFDTMKETFKEAIAPLQNIFDLSGLKKKFQDLFNTLNPANLINRLFQIDYKGKGKVEKLTNIDVPFANFAMGGVVPGVASTPGDSEMNDKILALLSPGERIIPRSALEDNGVKKVVDAIIRDGKLPKFGLGGVAGSVGGRLSSGAKSLGGAASSGAKEIGGAIAEGGKEAIGSVNPMDLLEKYKKVIERHATGFLSDMLSANALYRGGVVKGYATGGLIDDQLIAAQSGEFVVKRASVSSVGVDNLNNINASGQLPSGQTTQNNNVTIAEGAIQIDAGERDARELATELLEELKTRSLNGEFVISSQGIRET